MNGLFMNFFDDSLLFLFVKKNVRSKAIGFHFFLFLLIMIFGIL